jgi:DNA modification methylase
MVVRIINADVLAGLAQLPDESVHCVVTSPPYWGLRDYGQPGQIGLEATPDAFVARMVDVFREVRRVLRSDGTCWLNLGDSYAMSTKGSSGKGEKQTTNAGTLLADRSWNIPAGLKAKDLCGIPWRVALALQADGWWLRSDIIWSKPNPMPESVTDRPTKSHEYLFLLTKAERYYYDADAIKDATAQPLGVAKLTGQHKANAGGFTTNGTGNSTLGSNQGEASRNARSVWTIATAPFSEAHFATFPPELPARCIKAGSKPGDTILDPFGGAGTTALVADRLQRNAILIELNPEYAAMAEKRIFRDAGGLFAEVGVAAPAPTQPTQLSLLEAAE